MGSTGGIGLCGAAWASPRGAAGDTGTCGRGDSWAGGWIGAGPRVSGAGPYEVGVPGAIAGP